MPMASAVVGTLMKMWMTDDTIPLQNMYTNFLSYSVFGATGHFVKNNGNPHFERYRCTNGHVLRLHDSFHHPKLSFHSSSSNSIRNTLSHQSLLLTRIQHVRRDLLCSREAAKFNNKLLVRMTPSCSIWRRHLSSEINKSKSALHLFCKMIAYMTHKMRKGVASCCSSYAIFLECRLCSSSCKMFPA